MHFSLLNLIYFAFRMGPFLLVSFFIMSSFFNQDLKCIIYIAGLLFACFLGIATGNSLSIFDLPKGSLSSAHCHVLSLGEAIPLSSIPLSIIVYCYTAAYLAYPVMQFDKGSSDMSLIALFPLLILVELMWLHSYQCFNITSILVGGAFATAIGFLWSWIIYNSNLKGLHTFTIMGGGHACVRPAQTTFRCQQEQVSHLSGNMLDAYYKSGYNSGGKKYTTVPVKGTTPVGGPPGGPPPGPSGGNGNYYDYCILNNKNTTPPHATSAPPTCYHLYDGETVVCSNLNSNPMQFYRVECEAVPAGGTPGPTYSPPVLRPYPNKTILESWDPYYNTNYKKVLGYIPDGISTNNSPHMYLNIDNSRPVYYKIPDAGTILKYTGYFDVGSIINPSNSSEPRPYENSFYVHNFGTDQAPVLKLLQFMSQKDLDDFTGANINNVLLSENPRDLFQTSGCNSSNPDTFRHFCDFSGGSPSYTDLYGHTRNPITDHGAFSFTAPSSFKMLDKDKHIVKKSDTVYKTDIYPEGKIIRCKVGGKTPSTSTSTSTRNNMPGIRKPISMTLYRVDKYGALRPLPDNPQDWAVNYSWNDASGNDWLKPEMYPDCTGIDIGPELNFNPSLTVEACSAKDSAGISSCAQNSKAIAIMDYIPILYDYAKNQTVSTNGTTRNMIEDVSGQLINMLSDVQSRLIYKLVNKNISFNQDDYNSFNQDVKSIMNVFIKSNPIIGGSNVMPLRKLVHDLTNNQHDIKGWAGLVPFGNMIQITATNYCLEDGSNNRLIANTCDPNNPLQYWSYDPKNYTLNNDSTGRCVEGNKDNGNVSMTTGQSQGNGQFSMCSGWWSQPISLHSDGYMRIAPGELGVNSDQRDYTIGVYDPNQFLNILNSIYWWFHHRPIEIQPLEINNGSLFNDIANVKFTVLENDGTHYF